MFTKDEGASDIRYAVPFTELNWARLSNTVIWLGPAATILSAVSLPPVDRNVLFVYEMVDIAVVEALLMRTPVFVPPLTAKFDESIVAARIPFQPSLRPAVPTSVLANELPVDRKFIVEPSPPGRTLTTTLSAAAEVNELPC